MLRFENGRVIMVDNMQQREKGKKDELPLIKPKAGSAKGPSIPDFLMVEPDENTKKMEMQKQQLLEAIKPTEKSISAVCILCLPLLCLRSVSGHSLPALAAHVWADQQEGGCMLQVMETPALAQGFDDPEIMKAVEEIGKNPSRIQTKYANNAKVAQFYKAMAGHVGQQLTALGGSGKKVS